VQAATDAGIIYTARLHDQLIQAGYTEAQVEGPHRPDEPHPRRHQDDVQQQRRRAADRRAEVHPAARRHRPEKQTEIEALINQGRYDEANWALAVLAQGRTVDFTVNVHGGGQLTFTNSATGESFTEVDIAARNIPQRARGGRVEANRPYWVGDKHGMANAELFIPDQSGYVDPTVPSAPTATNAAPIQHFHIDGEPSEFTLMRFRNIARDVAHDVVMEAFA
jgi:hypothetical protein